ncbi:MAG: hypothetical protein IIC50_11885 [Planctomycetes bacterium]|nr:hypothetical protein [Planctomycetota bacterium]
MREWITNHRILLGWLGAATVVTFLATLFTVPWLVVRIWIINHRILLAASVVTFLATLFLVPWLVIRIPADYFTHQKRHRQAKQSQHPIIRITLIIAKNVLGCLFVVIGFIMLLVPGQGIMTMLIGVMFLDFPRKYQLERRLVSYGPVFRSINWLRHRARQDPLMLEFAKKETPVSGAKLTTRR